MNAALPKQSSTLLSRIETQGIVFGDDCKLSDVASIEKIASRKSFRVQLFRNHAVEPVVALVENLFSLSGFAVEFSVSDYDDSLSFAEIDPDAAAIIVWLDFARYETLSASALAAWLGERLDALQSLVAKPVIVVGPIDRSAPAQVLTATLRDALALRRGVQCVALDAVADAAHIEPVDAARSAITGARISRKIMLPLAKHLAFNALPPTLLPRFKAIIVDLDNTLYSGVLGEDGIAGIGFSAQHVALIAALVGYANVGVFIAVSSKNEMDDVLALFRERKELRALQPLIAVMRANWESKSSNLAHIADELNIGIDACVFIDDNVGELFEVNAAHPTLSLIHARDHAPFAHAILERFPRLVNYTHTTEDALRLGDFTANRERKTIASTTESLEAYLAALKPQLNVRVNCPQDHARLAQLSNKTNQFNTALRRFTEAEISELAQHTHHKLVAVSYKDRLSDSGVIGAFALAIDAAAARVTVLDCAVSCRSLGRGLESAVIAVAIDCCVGAGVTRVRFLYQRGERNAPAMRWLENFGATSDALASGHVDCTREALVQRGHALKKWIEIDVNHHG